MKTIKGALGIDPGRVKRNPAGFDPSSMAMPAAGQSGQMRKFTPPAKGSGQLGQYHRQQQIAQQQLGARPPMQVPQTGGPMYAPQGAGGVPPMTGGGFMMPQAGIGNFMQGQIGNMAPQGAGQFNPYAQQQMYGNAAGNMPQSVGGMTAQQRNPNYIQGR